jgi:epoxyqueuosine reductase QueG
MQKDDLQEQILKLTEYQGIDVLGITHAAEFKNYIIKSSKRRDPKLSLSDARTIIVAGIYVGGIVLPSWDKPDIGRTSRLYLSGFFSDVTKQIEPMAALLRSEGYAALICDTSMSGGSIIPLKIAAVRAGMGWQGKHSLLISRQYGTFLALGGIITNAGLDHNDKEESDLCKNCNKCKEACPLKALENEYVLDKGKCLSYILQNDDIPEEAKAELENRIIDCEICQQVCPWDAKHIKQPLKTPLTLGFQNSIPFWEDFFTLSKLFNLSERDYEDKLGHLKSGIPYSIFHRNVLMAVEYNEKGMG